MLNTWDLESKHNAFINCPDPELLSNSSWNSQTLTMCFSLNMLKVCIKYAHCILLRACLIIQFPTLWAEAPVFPKSSSFPHGRQNTDARSDRHAAPNCKHTHTTVSGRIIWKDSKKRISSSVFSSECFQL